MSPPRKRSKPRPPHAWRRVFYFANGKPSPKDWRQFLLELPANAPVPEIPTFGVQSYEELHQTLGAFKAFLGRLVHYPTIRAAEGSDFHRVLNERARGKLKGWIWARGTGRLFMRVETEDLTFEESLYAQLAMALTVESFSKFRQCENCERFFYEPKQRKVRLCSESCREAAALARAAHYRETHKEAYREYQRQLMARRRREGRA
jgi:hypothetical protein